MQPTCIFDPEEAKGKSVEELFQLLQSNKEGLTSEVAENRLKTYGPNTLPEKTESLLLKFFGYFWGPIPWMIEIAAILSYIIHHMADFYIIIVLLLINSFVGFYQEFQAGNAIAALKKTLAHKCLVKRNGNWSEIDAKGLVIGDIVRLRLGNIIPADCKLFEGTYLSVDQSALTGESLPVDKKIGDIVYSSSIAKQGEMVALVVATASNTFFGKTSKLVEEAKPTSHFQKAVIKIGNYLIFISCSLAVILIAVQLFRNTPFLELVQYVLILIIASIPVAMPAVLSVTMALGALRLSRMKAIITKLESIEEIAGIDILCSDKTGTLTQNKLSLGTPKVFRGLDPKTAITFGALASKAENQDPIDLTLIEATEKITGYIQEKFIPFDPIRKRADAVVKDEKGSFLFVTKGAPQIVLDLCHPDLELKKEVGEAIDDFAKKGHRTLGVARSYDEKSWEFLGLLPLFDPLREDSIETVQNAKNHGIIIKMLTGDNIAIAKEIAGQLHIGTNIHAASDIGKIDIEVADGFAEVFPQHKYEIVKALQAKKHIVGMTGDGVNDSPALKQAEVGIAVAGATDAAKAAASLALLLPGLTVIIQAVEEARRIFERMHSYAIYRIAETLRIMLFIVASILAFNFYPISAVMIILLALLNDIPILSIAYDNTLPQKEPVRWEMKRVLPIATALGLMGLIETFLLLWIAKFYLLLTIDQIQSIIFLKLSVAGHQTLFVARTKKAFYLKPFPAGILLGSILGTQVLAAFIVAYGVFMTAVAWKYIGLIWVYCLIWMFIEDGIKILIYHIQNKKLKMESRHLPFG